jgi:hypothetical protein
MLINCLNISTISIKALGEASKYRKNKKKFHFLFQETVFQQVIHNLLLKANIFYASSSILQKAYVGVKQTISPKNKSITIQLCTGAI